MKNEEYWKKRQSEKLENALKNAVADIEEVKRFYHKAYLYTDKQIEGIFDSYRNHHRTDSAPMSEKEARELLNNLVNDHDYAELKRKLENNPSSSAKKELLKKLDAPAYQARINRLMELQNKLDSLMMLEYNLEKEKSTDAYLKGIYDGYYRNVFNISKEIGIAYDFSEIDPELVDLMLKSTWYSKNYSKRIWGNAQNLGNELKDQLMLGVIMGKTHKEMSKTLQDKFAAGAANCERLVRTEMAAFINFIDLVNFKDAGIEKEMFIAVHDSRTSKICQRHDRSIINIQDAKIGVNVPPLHPNCRSHMIPYIEGITDDMKKRQRNPITGKDEVVDVKENYDQWLKRQQDKHGIDNFDTLKKKIKENRFEGPLKEMATKIYYKLTDKKKPISFTDLNDNIKDKVFMAISQSESSNAKDMFISQLSKIQILNERAIDIPHFTIESKKVGIRFNVKDDEIIDTLIHEIAHHIDYNLGKEYGSEVMLSNSKLFINTLKSDWDLFTVNMMKCYNCSTKKEFYNIFSSIMQKSQDSSYDFVSDIVSGLTGNACKGNCYHEKEYWNNVTLCAESFAHFYESILIDSRQEKKLKRIFPNAFKLFEELF